MLAISDIDTQTSHAPIASRFGSQASRQAFIDALAAKQKALYLLKPALEHLDSVGGEVVLAAVLFFMNFELIDPGSRGWRLHLEGAAKIMAWLRRDQKSEDIAAGLWTDCVISDCFM
jgi:hypothetical protein